VHISIITINFNNQDGLKRTIDSVVSQSFNDFEWIIIDGGSTDGSRELIEQNASRFAYWVSEPDSGIYNAMNKGIKKAKGEYLLFLNSGDYLYGERSLKQVVMAGLDADVVYGYIMVDKEGTKEIYKYQREITLATFIYETINHSGCAFIRRSLFDRYGLYDESLRIVSDWKFFLLSIGLGDASVKFVDVLVSVFDAGGIGTIDLELVSKERDFVLKSCVPERILKDYSKMEEERNDFLQRERMIRLSASYKLGKAIIDPLKRIKHLFVK
jgi:glycosyltransferase involved in cell wall biosynthesis